MLAELLRVLVLGLVLLNYLMGWHYLGEWRRAEMEEAADLQSVESDLELRLLEVVVDKLHFRRVGVALVADGQRHPPRLGLPGRR